MRQRILSIHSGHDASVALWEDYTQLVIFKEERLNRIKNWGRAFPELSFKKVVESVAQKDIDVLVLSRNYFHAKYFKENIKRRIKKRIKKLIGKEEKFISISMAMRLNGKENEIDVFNLSQFLNDYGFRNDVYVTFCDHHYAHALPTLFYSPDWDNALLYTSDGGGDGINYSFTYFNGIDLNVIYGGNDKLMKGWLPDSLGQMYSMTTEICGFKRNRHEGKITGLAAFGSPIAADEIISQYKLAPDGRILPKFKKYSKLYAILNKIHKKNGRDVLSSSVQFVLEELTLQSIRILRKKYHFDNIGLSGGVCSNVRLNQKISEVDGIKDLFVFPPMTDEGLVIGYILIYLLERDGLNSWLEKRCNLTDMYLGENLQLQRSQISDEFELICDHNIPEKAAELLADNYVCALFTSKMEYGPRALGARSILINPSDSSVNDIVNKRLERTEFMPFAPVVLEEMVEDVFDVTSSNRKAMQFMTITTTVKSAWKEKIQATVHVDGTARPQTIRREQNTLYYDILKNFYIKTGIPCLVNTSFNAHEEPIINTPQEALNALKSDRVDYIIFDDFILRCR